MRPTRMTVSARPPVVAGILVRQSNPSNGTFDHAHPSVSSQDNRAGSERERAQVPTIVPTRSSVDARTLPLDLRQRRFIGDCASTPVVSTVDVRVGQGFLGPPRETDPAGASPRPTHLAAGRSARAGPVPRGALDVVRGIPSSFTHHVGSLSRCPAPSEGLRSVGECGRKCPISASTTRRAFFLLQGGASLAGPTYVDKVRARSRGNWSIGQ